MSSRRDFLTDAGTGVALFTFPSITEKNRASYPDYPTIPQSLLDEQGWIQSDEWENEKEDALWRVRTYDWNWLQERVRDRTDGVIDIPLGGLIAIKIGNNGTTRRIMGNTVTNGEMFAFPRWKRRELREVIRRTYFSYLDGFSKIGFESTGELNWNFSPTFPATFGLYADQCVNGGTLTTQSEGDVKLTQHNLEYDLRDGTANESRDASLVTTRKLEFQGWLGSWIVDGQIYAVVGIHPNDRGRFCDLTDPHIESVVNDVVEAEVDLELENSLYGRVQSVMGAVR